MSKRLWFFLTCVMLSASMAFAQKSVSGTVIDQTTGEPLIGVHVKVNGQALAITDANGKFNLANMPESAKTVEFSYMGYEDVTGIVKSNMRVSMTPQTEKIDEVMIVAFGTQKKSAFTGSAAVVGQEQLEQHVTSNVASTLAGTVPGLQIRGGSGIAGASQGSIHIRGISSMYSNTDPLIIVDGATYSSSITNLNPDDIESITVLKDAASAALYGARAGSGVILITTKSGKTSEAQISVNMKWGANSRAVQDYKTITDPGQYYEAYYANLYNYAFYQGGMNPAAANAYANNAMINQLGYNVYTVPTGEQLIGLNGKLNPKATLGNIMVYNGEKYYLIPDNWKDEAYKTAFRQEYNVNISGRTDRGHYYSSVGYLDEDGIVSHTSYQRFTARFKADFNVKEWMQIGVNANFVNSETHSNPNLSYSETNVANMNYYTSSIAPIYPLYVRVLDANGNPVIRTNANGHPQYDWGIAGRDYPVNRAFLSNGNPIGANNFNNQYSHTRQLNFQGFANIYFTDWLKFNMTSSLIWGHTNASLMESMFSGNKASVNGELTKQQVDSYREDHSQQLDFNKSFGDHNVSAMIGHQYYHTNTKNLIGKGQGLFSPEIEELAAVAKILDTTSSSQSGYNVEGYFFNGMYNYQEKYFGSLYYRRDGSDMFAKDKWWGNFWSVGGAWLLSREDFMQDYKFINMLKLKASYGITGNDNTASYAYTNTYTISPSGTYTMSPKFRRRGNPDITWESSEVFNFGIEFGLWNDRLTGTIDFYNKLTDDLLFWRRIPESTGVTGYYGNLGDIRNRGLEISLIANPIRTKDINWTVSANISTNSAKVIKLPGESKNEFGGFSQSNDIANMMMWYEEGGSLYTPLLRKYAGVNEKGEALYYYDKDLSPLGGTVLSTNTDAPSDELSGVTTDANKATYYTSGSLLPDFIGGFGTTLKAYGFDFSLNFDYQIGGKIYDYQYLGLMNNVGQMFSGRTMHQDVLKAWTPNNTSSNIPRMLYDDQYTTTSSDRWLTNASYLNFQSFTVGYTLPTKITANLGISKVRVYATGENLCFWSARQGMDPRYSFDTGEYLSTVSPARTIMGGIQVTF